jgi:asparagine synthase (glutamine-hydrolysing)
MFAIAIWDSDKQLLVLARDRLGKKPLYYTNTGNRLAFASEVKAFFNIPGFQFTPNLSGIWQYFNYRFTTAPDTVFKNIYKLPPGHILIYVDSRITVLPYWNLLEHAQEFQEKRVTEDEYRKLLKKSVELRLMSDVPLGVYLSGGIDSSTLVALITEISKRPTNTYSIVFPGETVDESNFSRRVSNYFNTTHFEMVCEPKDFDIFDKIVYHLEEPLGDPAIIPTYFLSELAKKHVTVILTGEGSDEINAGYYKYLKLYRLSFVNRIPQILSNVIRNSFFSKSFLSSLPNDALNSIKGISEVLKNMSFAGRAFFASDELFSPEFLHYIQNTHTEDIYSSYLKQTKNMDLLQTYLFLDMKTWLADDLLLKVDKMSMAHALEARAPFLDHKFVEMAMKIHPNEKVNWMATKTFLRNIMRKSLPHEILRRRQHGLVLPLSTWFKGSLRDYLNDTIKSTIVVNSGLFNHREVDKRLNSYFTNKSTQDIPIFMLLMISTWFRVFTSCGNKDTSRH